MPEEEKQRIYQEVRETLLALSYEQLSKMNNNIKITNGTIVGCLVSCLIFGYFDPNFIYAVPLTGLGISLITNILCRINRRRIINKADEDAKSIADETANLSINIGDLGYLMSAIIADAASIVVGSPEDGIYMGFMPFGVETNIDSPEETIEADFEVLDENGNKLNGDIAR